MVAVIIYEAATTGRITHLISKLAKESELVNACVDDGFQPLGLAACFRNAEMVEHLIKAGEDISSP